jgi:hypothetical protein
MLNVGYIVLGVGLGDDTRSTTQPSYLLTIKFVMLISM